MIKEKEFEILSNLNFKIDFSTSFKFLGRILYQIFQNLESSTVISIRKGAIIILKMILYDIEFNSYKPSVIAISALIFSIKTHFLEFKDNSSVEDFTSFEEQENIIVIFIKIKIFFK